MSSSSSLPCLGTTVKEILDPPLSHRDFVVFSWDLEKHQRSITCETIETLVGAARLQSIPSVIEEIIQRLLNHRRGITVQREETLRMTRDGRKESTQYSREREEERGREREREKHDEEDDDDTEGVVCSCSFS
jgi:hypothetical protein